MKGVRKMKLLAQRSLRGNRRAGSGGSNLRTLNRTCTDCGAKNCRSLCGGLCEKCDQKVRGRVKSKYLLKSTKKEAAVRKVVAFQPVELTVPMPDRRQRRTREKDKGE